jgi:quinol monooxygenase YgiN
MSDITVTMIWTIKPESAEAFFAALPQILAETGEQDGFCDIRAVRLKEDANKVLFVETWASEEAFHTYIAWRTERGDIERMGASFAAPPEFGIWPVTVARFRSQRAAA